MKILGISIGGELAFGVGSFKEMSREWLDKHNPEVGGYYVLYNDGYESFSPAKAFEEGYSLIERDPYASVRAVVEAETSNAG